MSQASSEVFRTLPRLLTVRQASLALGISISKVYELVASHELPAFKPGGRIRISEDALQAYLSRTRVS